jgi:hypothetical protein
MPSACNCYDWHESSLLHAVYTRSKMTLEINNRMQLQSVAANGLAIHTVNPAQFTQSQKSQ